MHAPCRASGCVPPRPPTPFTYPRTPTLVRDLRPPHAAPASWSANVVGRKYWLLFPPSETGKLQDVHGREVAADARPPPHGRSTCPWLGRHRDDDVGEGDAGGEPCDCAPWMVRPLGTCGEEADLARRFPLLPTAVPRAFVQLPGEVMFVPSGWYHQVRHGGARWWGGMLCRTCVGLEGGG